MSSSSIDSEHKNSPKPSAIQDTIGSIIRELANKLSESHQREEKVKADSHQQVTASSAAANNQTADKQDGDGDNEDVSNKQKDKDDVNQQETNDESNEKVNITITSSESESKKNHVQRQSNEKDTSSNSKKKNEKEFVLHELEKLCKELQYVHRSFEKLDRFSTNLKEPLKTLEKNVTDILKDLDEVTDSHLPKQVPLNLRVLRNNITRVKIQIPLQHQTANANSEANRPWQTTVATSEVDDLPQLCFETIFESSYYFQEIKDKYDALDKRHKLCLLCFAIFPEDAEIKKRLLRFWWVAENLVPPEEGKDEMTIVSDTLQKFVEDGFIEPIQKKSKLLPRSYKMNPYVRSSLIKFAKEALFFDYDQEGNPTMDFSSCKKACMLKLTSEGAIVPWFSEYLEDTEKYLEKNPKAERLSADLVKLQMLFSFPSRDILLQASQQFSELQTLFNVSRQFPALPKEWFSKMKDIKVLYLGSWEPGAGRRRHIEVEDIDFLRGLKSMNKLRLLSLQGISGIPRLPSSLCKLASLKILDLRACHNLEKLPDMIGSLKKLTYLDVSECYLLDHMPKELKKLSELEVLKGFVIGNVKNSCTLEDLTKLAKLRKLSVNVNVNTKNFEIEKAGEAIRKFKNLKKLRIAWGSGSKEMENSSGQQADHSSSAGDEANSKSMKREVRNNKEQTIVEAKSESDDKKGKGAELRKAANVAMAVTKLMPDGLNNLVKLDLQCFPNKKPPTWLVAWKLRNLQSLSLRGGRLGYLIPDDHVRWKHVKILRLKFLIDFKINWKDMLDQFPNLEHLENVRCPRVTFCPCDANGVWQKSSINEFGNV